MRRFIGHNPAMSGRWGSVVGSRWGRRRWTLAGRMLLMQLGIVLIVLVGVAAVSIAQSQERLKDTESRRALAVAEGLADNAGVREAASSVDDVFSSQAQSVVATGKQFSGSSTVMIARTDGRVIASTDPLPLDREVRVQLTDAMQGRSWVGVQEGTGSAMAMVPVINPQTRRTDGVVAVVRDYPSVIDDLGAAMPSLLTYLGIATVLGVVGSLLLAQRVKRQTLGLEPREIAGLVEQREAVLHGLKEGVLAVDLQGVVTLVNDEAAHLLGIPQTSTGRTLSEVDPSGRVRDIFESPHPATDQVVPINGRLVTLNRRPVQSRGRPIGHVVTLRDRTQMLELQNELDRTLQATDTLRAQAHEFSNRMHVVSGLIELEQYDDVRSYVRQLTADRTQWFTSVGSVVKDPAVAALVIAKASQATERGVTFLIDEGSELPRLDEQLSADVTTVLGNLVDNAMDAAAESADPIVRATLRLEGEEVVVVVRDSGPGVDERVGAGVFRKGFSTKPTRPGGRGVGLTLVRLICTKRGGAVTVENDNGAVFTVRLPVRRPVAAS